MPDDLSMDNNQDTTPKKGILQSLQSLTFSHDDDLDDNVAAPAEPISSVGPAPMAAPEPTAMTPKEPITNLERTSKSTNRKLPKLFRWHGKFSDNL